MTIFLLIIMIAAAIWAVMARSLVKAAIALAITSAVLTIIMFGLNAQLAAIFELSVCAGLITVIVLSTISLIKPLTKGEMAEISKMRNKRYIYLPILLVAAAVVMYFFVRIPGSIKIATGASSVGVNELLWNTRRLDLFGQIVVLLGGALGIAVLFKGKGRDER